VNQLTTIFLGPQGSGKGTQIQLLKDYLVKSDPSRAIVHFEMGKMLRDRGGKEDFTGQQTKEILAGGNLIPYVISASLFALYLMDNLKSGDEHLIIDGFPRTADQVPTLDSAMKFFKRENTNVVCINISDEEAVKRLLLRGRSDDTEEAIRKRLQWSREQTMPNIEWFRKTPGYTVLDIDGEGTIEQTHEKVFKALGIL
jgi:adenylate kinase